jgi:hypothetical protein
MPHHAVDSVSSGKVTAGIVARAIPPLQRLAADSPQLRNTTSGLILPF